MRLWLLHLERMNFKNNDQTLGDQPNHLAFVAARFAKRKAPTKQGLSQFTRATWQTPPPPLRSFASAY